MEGRGKGKSGVSFHILYRDLVLLSFLSEGDLEVQSQAQAAVILASG